MPHVINGIGTWYWGKRNITLRRGQCGSCGAVGDLASYDTTKFFVVLFIPVIPLGGKRIIDQCPHCRRHRVASLKEWERARTEKLGDAAIRWHENPLNPELAIEAIRVAAAFDARDEFGGIAASLDPSLLQNPEVLAVLAAAYGYFGMAEDAEETLRSLAATGNQDAERELAIHLLKHGKPADARPYLDPILERARPEDAGLVLFAAISYQAVGDHPGATDILTRYGPRFPGLEASKDFRKAMKVSRGRGAAARPIKSALIIDPRAAARATGTRSGWRFRAARLWPVAVLVLAFGGYLAAAVVAGQSRRVFLVNGLDRPYDVTVQGKRCSLPTKSHREIQVAEGDLLVHALDTSLSIPDFTVPVRTSFLTRPFTRVTFVINPDELAVLDLEERSYASNPSSAPHGRDKIQATRPWYLFHDLDYPFQQFPSSLTMSSSASAVSKRGVEQLRLNPVTDTALVLTNYGPAAAAKYAAMGIRRDPSNAERYNALGAFTAPADALNAVEPLTKVRPIIIEAHRTYQSLCERLHPGQDLESQYRALADAEPTNPVLTYLLGRVSSSRARARELFEAAATANPPVPQAFVALAYDLIARGEFGPALEALAKAKALKHSGVNLAIQERSCLSALGRYDEWLAQPFSNGDPLLDPWMERVCILSLANRGGEIAGVIDQHTSGDPDGQQARSHALADIAYCRGDVAECLRQLEKVGSDTARFQAAVIAGKLEEARQAIAHPTSGPAGVRDNREHLVLALAASLAGNSSLSQSELATGIDSLRANGREERTAASWLAGEAEPKPGEPTELALTPELKALILPLVAQRWPDRRDECLALARKLNFDRRFPHLLIARAVGVK